MAKEENKVLAFIDDFMLHEQWMPVKINSGQKGYVWFNEWRIPASVEAQMIRQMSSAEIVAWYQSPGPPYHSGIPDREYFRDGVTLFVEGKTKTGKARYWQNIFAKVVRIMGFNCIIPKGEQDFIMQYNNLFTKDDE